MYPTDTYQPRMINGITVLGPDILAKDPAGKPLSPIASIFPYEAVLVTGQGIHAELIARGIDYLRARLFQSDQRDMTPQEEQEYYRNVVSMLTRDSTVLIRSRPEDMDRVFAADEVLQQMLPKECIQFTGIHIRGVRERMRRRGESWRISAPPTSINEISHHISASRVQVNTGATYYQNAQTGERFLTCEEFQRIRPLMRMDPQEALARLKEIHQLSRLVNDLGVHELSFFLPAQRKLTAEPLGELIAALENSIARNSRQDWDRAEDLFHNFALSYGEAAGEELIVDGEKHTTWQTTMFCRLYELNEEVVEELTLGLSPEFHFNVRWLPGAQLNGKDITFEINTEQRVRNLIHHFLEEWPDIVSINVGRVESPLTKRDRTGEERQVYLVVLGLPHGGEEIRLVRMMKWGVVHRLKQGFPLEQAVGDTITYYDYICDRLNCMTAIEIPILSYTPIRFTEEIPGTGEVPVFFFDRHYVPGFVTDKIRPTFYARKGFIARLARLLGRAAAASMVSGRASVRTGEIFFDDGDEVVQLNAEGLPDRLVICETTGSFTDWTTPILELLPQCMARLAAHLEKARGKGVLREDLQSATEAFTEALVEEIERMQSLLNQRSAALRSLLDARTAEPRSVRVRWSSLLDRLAAADTSEIRHTALSSPHVGEFMNP